MTSNSQDIIPGVGIGEFSLGMTESEIIDILHSYVKSDLPNFWVLYSAPYRIWICKRTNKASQISVEHGYTGKFLGSIGIGNTLTDLESAAGSYYEDLDTYQLKHMPGIAFDLEDSDDWDERLNPINYISVFL